MEWISVNDRLPELDDEVLVFTRSQLQLVAYRTDTDTPHYANNPKEPIQWVNYVPSESYSPYVDEYYSSVTHWMPLPEPPDKVQVDE